MWRGRSAGLNFIPDHQTREEEKGKRLTSGGGGGQKLKEIGKDAARTLSKFDFDCGFRVERERESKLLLVIVLNATTSSQSSDGSRC